jgi:signal transduction histidine kinase
MVFGVETMPLGRRPYGEHVRNPELVFGDFEASALIGGHWRTAAPARSEIYPWRWRALLWLVLATLVVAPFAWILSRGLARPIGLFADAAERLGRDLKSPPLALEGSRELVHAAGAFNEMQARLSRYVEDRTTFMAAIAHDLRTPLMRLRLRLEGAEPGMREACEPDIRDMEQMIASVMALLRDMQQRPRRKLDLRALAESTAHHFIDLGGEVELEDGPPIVVEGDSAGLKALFANLIGNAVQYAGGARVTLSTRAGEAVIDVNDDGPGMATDDLAHAFEPFFRAERSRNRETGGIGLGLASVRAVARAHGGEAQIANRPEGGLSVQVVLPMPASLGAEDLVRVEARKP